jgi:hypothetical protein
VRRIAAVAPKLSISGICTSIKNKVEGLSAPRRHRLFSIVGENHPMPLFLQQVDRDTLVHHVILGQQDVPGKGVRRVGKGGAADFGASRPSGASSNGQKIKTICAQNKIGSLNEEQKVDSIAGVRDGHGEPGAVWGK